MIDYQILSHSTHFYQERNYQRIESPWTVTKAVSWITKPPNAKDWSIEGKDKVLVASGEQSFLYLYLKGFLPLGQYQTITPCFREEPFDLTHSKYFMKNELIITDDVNSQSLWRIIRDALSFFELYLPKEHLRSLMTDTDTYDIEYKGIELGSYGIRSCTYLNWIYGTGVAEPRLSTVMGKHGLSYESNTKR